MWLSKTQILKDAIGIECNTKKKVLCSAEKSSVIWAKPHNRSSAKPNVRLVTSTYKLTSLVKFQKLGN